MMDMTKGNPVRLILTFMGPLIIGNIFQQLYTMVDTAIVGTFVGVDALAAVGATGGLVFLIIGFVMGLTQGMGVIISQRFGANDEEGIKQSIGMSYLISTIAVVVLTVLSLLVTKPLLEIMNTPANIMNDSLTYITIIFLGIGATFLYNLVAAILRALGDSKTPLYFLMFASVLNIVLDLVFIINFNMGVAGAALATVLSQGIGGLLCFIYMIRKFELVKLGRHHFKYSALLVKELLNISIPMALQYSITSIGVILVQGAINAFGSVTVAAYTAAIRVEGLIIQPSIALGTAVATYCAQNLGAHNFDRIREGVKKGAIITIGMNIIGALLIAAFSAPIIELFISEQVNEVIPLAQQYLFTAACFYPVLGILFLYRFALQGLGNGTAPMFSGFIELAMRTAIAFTLPATLGYPGICLASPAAWIGAAVWLVYSYRKTIKTVEADLA